MKEMSYYKNGIKAKKSDGTLLIESVYDYIRNHPQKELILELRTINKGTVRYTSIKEVLPVITPHATFTGGRKLSEISELSNYLYFDIDCDTEDVIINIRENLLSNHKDVIKLLSMSVGGRGLCFYIEVDRLTVDNYQQVHDYFIKEVFKNYPIDNNAKGLNRCHILPYDEDAYFNEISKVISVSEIVNDIPIGRKLTVNNKLNIKIGYTVNFPFLDIKTLNEILRFKPEIDTKGKLFLIKEEPYVKVFCPKNIPDGKKHTTFRAITQALLFNNPDASLHAIQSYIFYVNRICTTKRMNIRELVRTVEAEYNRVKETGELTIQVNTKCIHIHADAGLDRGDRHALAVKLNGLIKIKSSVSKILSAIEELNQTKRPVSKTKVAQMTGLSVKTVRAHWDKTEKGIGAFIDSMNRTVHNGVSDSHNRDVVQDEEICSRLKF